MMPADFIHIDGDACHDQTLTLHDCVAEKVCFSDGCLRFYLPDGFWITPTHDANNLDKTIRTDAAVVDFRIEDVDDIIVQVFTRYRFRKTKVEIWEMQDLMNAINKGDCSLEFIFQYRTYFEQMWQCAIRSKRRPYYRECQLHLPNADAAFCWNHLRPECEW